MDIALCGFYGKNNFGDDLMQDCLQDVLKQNHTNVVNIFSDRSQFNISNGFADKSYLNNDVIVIGGGGIISPNFWVFKDNNLEQLIASEKPVLFLNVSLYLEQLPFIEQLKKIKKQFWFVRDKFTLDFLYKNNIPVEFLPDISTALVSDVDDTINNKKLTVFLNSYVFNSLFSKDYNKFLEHHYKINILSDFIDWLVDFDWQVLYIPCQVSTGVNDIICNGICYQLQNNKSKSDCINHKLNWKDTFNHIASSRLVLSMRYHPTVIALSNTIPTVDITHHIKNSKFVCENNLKKLSVDYSLINNSALINAAIYAEKLDYKESMISYKIKSMRMWKEFESKWVDFIA